MKFDVFLKSWQGTQLENRWQRFLIAVLVLSNLLLAVAAFSRNTVVAIQPPTLSETAEVSRNQATQPYLKSWGLYLAELMGNVTPGNVSFIRVAIEPLLSPAVYQQVVDALEIQARQIREDRVALKFQPRQVEYEYETGHVFVTGYSLVSGPSGDEQRQTRTYEFDIDIEQYRPKLSWMDTYEGQARTKRVREKLTQEQNRRVNDANQN
ncbi:TraE/TraK family type IV conjugative transfer system protein [Vibrio alginolyticus]|uniref:TraE/TraK family type IV conjugative transfer system protein n=1 Tax=Vibrio TaxID=662 RepID=UPI002963ED51|nr:TraE/TraK family type IV conjugative transfer system protein [Vibrio sp. Vb2976]MDW1643017.1 TraE/TraK family type IV conjugative transfer system protein [Vibrio sp. Vb2976]